MDLMKLRQEIAEMLSDETNTPFFNQNKAIAHAIRSVNQSHVNQAATQNLANQMFGELLNVIGSMSEVVVELYSDVSITTTCRSFHNIVTMGSLSRL